MKIYDNTPRTGDSAREIPVAPHLRVRDVVSQQRFRSNDPYAERFVSVHPSGRRTAWRQKTGFSRCAPPMPPALAFRDGNQRASHVNLKLQRDSSD